MSVHVMHNTLHMASMTECVCVCCELIGLLPVLAETLYICNMYYKV